MTNKGRHARMTQVAKPMMPQLVRENSSMTVMSCAREGWKSKGIQCVDSTMASASSNHHFAAILHTTRSTVKNNLTVKISKLTN